MFKIKWIEDYQLHTGRKKIHITKIILKEICEPSTVH